MEILQKQFDPWSYPQLIAHTSELKHTGDFIRLPFARGEDVVFQMEEQYPFPNIHVLQNICPHRGAQIFTGSCGNQEPVCPYHGKEAQKTDSIKLSYEREFLFGKSALGCADTFKGIRLSLHNISEHIINLHSRDEMVIDCPWQVAVENALEATHVKRVHKDSLAKTISQHGQNYFDEYSSTWHTDVKDSVKDTMASLAPKAMPYYEHTFIFPFTCIARLDPFLVSIQQYFPTKDGKTHMLFRLYATRQSLSPAMLAETRSFSLRVFEEDKRICERIPAYVQGPIDRGEERIAHFRKLLAAI